MGFWNGGRESCLISQLGSNEGGGEGVGMKRRLVLGFRLVHEGWTYMGECRKNGLMDEWCQDSPSIRVLWVPFMDGWMDRWVGVRMVNGWMRPGLCLFAKMDGCILDGWNFPNPSPFSSISMTFLESADDVIIVE